MATIVLYAPQGAAAAQVEWVEQLAAELAARRHRVLLVPDLYDLPEESVVWSALRELAEPVALLGWLHPRALQWLLHRRGVTRPCALLLDLATVTAPEVIPAELAATGEGSGRVERVGERGAERWYPVTDLSRCTHCGHCLAFCRFGVYEHEADGRVSVTHPDHCKPGCPACSRVCPTGAIMFPRYAKDPAIAGADGLRIKRNPRSLQKLYARLERPCPLCGEKTESEAAALGKEGYCPECGRGLGE